MDERAGWSYATTTDLLAAAPQHRIPERNLFAEVVNRALLDIREDEGQAAVDAYRWIVRQHMGFRFYCRAIDLDPARVAAVIAERYDTRIAAIRKKLRELKR